MKVIVAGGRDFNRYDVVDAVLSYWKDSIPISEVVCGCASGADSLGRLWATAHKLPVAEFPADWNAHGKGAGHIRNQQMADYANGLIYFPGGRGTADMLRRSEEAAKKKKFLILDGWAAWIIIQEKQRV